MVIPYASNYDETIAFGDTNVQFSLATNIVQTHTIPGDATKKYVVIFGLRSDSNVLISKNTTAAIPAGGTKTTLQYVEFCVPGEKRYVNGGDVLSLITPDASALVTISIRAIAS